MQIVGVEPPLDPNEAASWSLLAPMLEPKFLWLPWNYVTPWRSLAALIASERSAPVTASGTLDQPAVVVTDTLLTTYRGRLDEYVRDPDLPRADAPAPMGVACRRQCLVVTPSGCWSANRASRATASTRTSTGGCAGRRCDGSRIHR